MKILTPHRIATLLARETLGSAVDEDANGPLR